MPIFIDGHVHIHSGFNRERFFSAAFENFSKVTAEKTEKKISGNANYILVLTEGSDTDVFSCLREDALASEKGIRLLSDSSDSLCFYKTGESNSLVVCKGAQQIVLVAGSQLVSAENVEVLSLFTQVTLQDKSLSLTDVVQEVVDKGGIPVIPWGVGKWFGARGKLVHQLLSAKREGVLFFGDNGNRPSFWPQPTLLRRACELHFPLLSGSDPLPLASHCERPGSFGSWLPDAEISMETPAASLRALLVSLQSNELKSFGDPFNSVHFFLDQLRINVGKQISRFSSSS